jgi:hypothetical protein
LEKQVVDFYDKSTSEVPQRSSTVVGRLLARQTGKRGTGTRSNKQDIDKLKSINLNDYAEKECRQRFKRSRVACVNKLQV